jgi:hypothetical protein
MKVLQAVLQKHAAIFFTVREALNSSEWGCSSITAPHATYIVTTFFVIIDEVLFPAQNYNIMRK